MESTQHGTYTEGRCIQHWHRSIITTIVDNNIFSPLLSVYPKGGILYFKNLREYASMTEVEKITGTSDSSKFPPPPLWRQGEGINLFWEVYEKETGCSQSSLNRQNIIAVQQKLVRVLCNYEFAKFCWKSLVKPALSQNASVDAKRLRTNWLLDRNSQTSNNKGFLNSLVQHVHQRASDMEEKKSALSGLDSTILFHYDVHMTLRLDRVELGVGNGLLFAK